MIILILGGYGIFGGRLAHLLAAEARLNLLIAGRSMEKAVAFCAALPAGAARQALVFDRDGDVAGQIGRLRPDLVVDASGPFQIYGGDPYRVVKASLAAGAHYMDLADGSDFVKGISRFDQQARSLGLFVLSGVSSFPVLTAAVVRHLSQGMARIDKVAGGIAPSPYAGVGLNVLRAISSYAGKPLVLLRDGRQDRGYALTETMRYTISPPGRLPLHSTRFSLVDVPDLQVLPALWPGLRTVWMGAGPVPEVLHRCLNGLAWLVRVRLLPSLSVFAPLFHLAINLLRRGEHRGGMFVAVDGVNAAGKPVERSWHLLAEGSDGPLIPSMAVEALVCRSLAGRAPAPGARPATTELELADYDALFRKRTIYTGVRESPAADSTQTLYRRVLGDAWGLLPVPIQAMHDGPAQRQAEGRARVERGRNPLARLVGALVGFPPAGEDLALRVDFQPAQDGEVWTRNFAGRSLSSVQAAGRGRSEHLLTERFGPFTFGLALVVEDGRLDLVIRRWGMLGLPLPLALAPRNRASESVVDGRFHFDVEVGHALTGLIVRYRGWLAPM